ncbi:MAG: hypothetical protein Q4D87_08940 [Actinomycetaceae bacterium]|nr:hypothetical protein [Actinomycetaceae bacterium]
MSEVNDIVQARGDLVRAREALWKAIDVAEPGQLPALVAQLRGVLRDLDALEPGGAARVETVAQRLQRERMSKRGA